MLFHAVEINVCSLWLLHIHLPGEWSVCSSVPGCSQGSWSGSREEQRQRWSDSYRPSSWCLWDSHYCPPGSWAQVTYSSRIKGQTSACEVNLLWITSAVYFNRRRGGKYAVGSACIGGGQGIGIILEKCWRRRQIDKFMSMKITHCLSNKQCASYFDSISDSRFFFVFFNLKTWLFFVSTPVFCFSVFVQKKGCFLYAEITIKKCIVLHFETFPLDCI